MLELRCNSDKLTQEIVRVSDLLECKEGVLLDSYRLELTKEAKSIINTYIKDSLTKYNYLVIKETYQNCYSSVHEFTLYESESECYQCKL